MKAIVYILLLSIFIGACQKEKIDPNTYQVSVRENFTDSLKQIENIQVDDYVPYTITLTDSKDGGEYRLTSLKKGERYHQTIGKDFVFSLSNDPNIPINKEQKYIAFTNKGVHNFYIRPLVPGTFKLTFELQKFVDGEPVGEAIKINISFNVVKIKLMATELYIFPFNDRYFYNMIIDDGEGEEDTYLSNENQTQTLNVSYLVNDEITIKEKGIFKGNEKFELLELRGAYQRNVSVKYIKIIQKSNYHPDFVIEYSNLNIKSNSNF